MLENEKYSEFSKNAKSLLTNIYPFARDFIRLLIENKVPRYLITLAPDFVARDVVRDLKMTGFWSMKYKCYHKNPKKGLFTGEFEKDVKDFSGFKVGGLEALLGPNPQEKNLLVVGDSLDDVGLFECAKMKIAVNPNEKILQKEDFTAILSGKEDSWQGFMKYLANR